MERRDGYFRKAIAFLLVTIMAVSFIPVFSASNANAATKKGRLVKSVTRQYYNTAKKKWINDTKETYKYNKKGDPIRIKTVDYSEKGEQVDSWTVKNTFKYTKKSVRKSRKSSWKTDEGFKSYSENWTYDKKGNPKKLVYSESDEDGRWENHTHAYTYTKKGWYLKKDNYTWRDHYMDEEDDDFTGKDKYTVKQNKYLLKSIISYRFEDSIWEKNETMSFNKRGFISKCKNADGSDTTTYRYTMKKGRVTTVVETYKSNEDTSKYRYKITYTKKKKIGKIRYAKMINDIVTAGSYQLYPWY